MATRFYPHPAFAEDQPYARTILAEHVIHRGAQVGALFGSFTGAARLAFGRSKPASAVLLRTTGVGTLIGGAVLGAGSLGGRMWGRDEIEWKDRSWRLLENRGQVDVDDWSTAGTVAGLLGVLVRKGGRAGLVRIVGGAGLGNLAGVGGYVAWRLLKGNPRAELVS